MKRILRWFLIDRMKSMTGCTSFRLGEVGKKKELSIPVEQHLTDSMIYKCRACDAPGVSSRYLVSASLDQTNGCGRLNAFQADFVPLVSGLSGN